MEPIELARKIVELRLALRRVCMCEEGDKQLLNLKTKTLFLISGAHQVSTAHLVEQLMVSKSNLALMARELEEQNLIRTIHGTQDRRTVSFSITEKGKRYLEARLRKIALKMSSCTETDEDRDALYSHLDELLSALSFGSI